MRNEHDDCLVLVLCHHDLTVVGDKPMTKKIYAANPDVRGQECDHPFGFPYTGTIPCTGPEICPLCGTHREDAAGFDVSTPGVAAP